MKKETRQSWLVLAGALGIITLMGLFTTWLGVQ